MSQFERGTSAICLSPIAGCPTLLRSELDKRQRGKERETKSMNICIFLFTYISITYFPYLNRNGRILKNPRARKVKQKDRSPCCPYISISINDRSNNKEAGMYKNHRTIRANKNFHFCASSARNLYIQCIHKYPMIYV